jgi:hypothetical protein
VSEKSLSWRQLIAKIKATIPKDQLDEPASFREPYDDAATFTIKDIVELEYDEDHEDYDADEDHPEYGMVA